MHQPGFDPGSWELGIPEFYHWTTDASKTTIIFQLITNFV